jgi:hypothetical protein
MKYHIESTGQTIMADQAFVEAHFPGDYTLVTDAPAMEDPRIWWIDVGPFKDRLGMDALAIAASSHDACKAVIEMLNGRKYVDLKDSKTTMLLGILQATNQPAANAIFAGSGPITAGKITAITTTPTTEAERHIKGLT